MNYSSKLGWKIRFSISFPIIPIDILAEIIVANLQEEKAGQGLQFIRPVLNQPVTNDHFQPIATGLFGLKLTDRETMMNAGVSTRKFNFLIPKNFSELLEKVSLLSSVMPDIIRNESLPDPSSVLLSNLNNRLMAPKYQRYFKTQSS